MKILYAADNRIGSHFQLKRFLASMKRRKHQIKVAAYKYTADDIDIDYTLDALLNFSDPTEYYSTNDNYAYYYNEVKRFSPDVIISDLEIYTSNIALELSIKLIQASPILLYYALPHEVKYNSNITRNNMFLLGIDAKKRAHINNMVNSSDKKLVISHLCDTKSPPKLNDGFKYVRPDFILSDGKPSQFDTLAIMNTIPSLPNAINFNYDEMDPNYNAAINGCNSFLNEGMEVFLSDAFYNQKFSVTIPKHDDMEAIICSYMNQYYGFGRIATTSNIDTTPKSFDISIDDNIKFLWEEVEA